MSSKDNFDLKTAVSLLPTMDGTETVTNQLIDAIELYETIIKEADIKMLINFVLKTRLTQSAKLRLSNTYDTIKNLVDDMKTHLLTKKSATAIQTKIMSTRQGGRSIEHYGQELEDLLVNLTITQANNNPEAYKILKPINEKTAIHKFADGLRNEKLSTIIAAHGYNSLKDAIQGAKDQEVSMTSASTSQGHVMHMRKGIYPYKKPFRGNQQERYPERQNLNIYARKRFVTPRYNTRGTYRSRYPIHSQRRRQYHAKNNRNQINVVEQDNSNENKMQFFRE